mgnify:CR=1 FL=1
MFVGPHGPGYLDEEGMIAGVGPFDLYPVHHVPVAVLVLETGQDKFALPEIKGKGIGPFPLGRIVGQFRIVDPSTQPDPGAQFVLDA